MNPLRRTYEAVVEQQKTDDAPPDEVPPTTMRTKLAMFAVTFLSAIVGTVTLQRFRRLRRRRAAE